MLQQNIIVITRPLEDQEVFSQKVKSLGLQVFSYPTISIKEITLTNEQEAMVQNIGNFEWIVFTSKNGVRYFLQKLQTRNIDVHILKTKKIAVIGPRTRKEAMVNNLHIDFMSSVFTNENLGKELPDVDGKKILLPRATIASKILPEMLQKRGAHVVDLSIYQTTFPEKTNKPFEKLVKENKVKIIIFTSPSTIEGLVKNLSDDRKDIVLQTPIVVIGPVTAKAAKEYGFQTIHQAKTFTSEGIIKKLEEIV